MVDQRSEIAQEIFSDPPPELFITNFEKLIISNFGGGSEIRDCSESFL